MIPTLSFILHGSKFGKRTGRLAFTFSLASPFSAKKAQNGPVQFEGYILDKQGKINLTPM
jgi:hypothetical protein